ncbi:NaeI family type II restriction endonuclease [Streptomyces sp. NPDC094448]|uniref:NaeI family type II restriction endonuclease n=1 Tax=Streptomyces sp. NPDC094448 TaxID=3366063 RepID=UPI0037F3E32A
MSEPAEEAMLPLDLSAAANTAALATAGGPDTGLDAVFGRLPSGESCEAQFGRILRQSIDEVLDGQRTGRFDILDLEKTEKTYLGTKVEIITRAHFSWERGRHMDYAIAGQDVDAKFTVGSNWTIPAEAVGHICLLMRANDHKSQFQVGLVRIREELLNRGQNRDGKKTLSVLGRQAIRWLVPAGALPPNILLSLTPEARSAVFMAGGGGRGPRGGQARTNALFRHVQGRLVDRNTVLTVASQDDGPKRVRDSRNHLRGEGIMILGHQNQHPHIARALDLPVPDKGSWIAVKTVRLDPGTEDSRPVAHIGTGAYAVWREGDAAPQAPESY